MIDRPIIRTIMWGLAIVMLLSLPVGAQVEEDWPEPNYLDRCTALEFEAGYFTALREDFRMLYGSSAAFALALEHRESTRWSWRLRAEFESLSEVSDNLRYWHISAVPLSTYTISEVPSLRRMVGAGVGVDVRTIRVMYYYPGYLYDQPAEVLSDTKAAAVAMVYAGLDFRPNRGVSIGLHLYFDRHFQGDTSRGAFGDTGGLHVMGSLGFWM